MRIHVCACNPISRATERGKKDEDVESDSEIQFNQVRTMKVSANGGETLVSRGELVFRTDRSVATLIFSLSECFRSVC